MTINIDDIMNHYGADLVDDTVDGAQLPTRKAAVFLAKNPCRHCGERERYVSSRGCVQCARDKNVSREYQKAKLAREIAAHKGESTYTGRPCKVCSNTIKYTLNAGCTHCAAVKRDAFRRNRAKAYHSDDSLIMWVNHAPAKGCEHYYQQIPALAARPDGGQWSVRYTDAKHLMPGGERLLTGRDVMERPDFAQWLLNEMIMGVQRTGGHHDILPHIAAPLKAAYLDYCRRRKETRKKVLSASQNHK